ncbi:hypothetical protein ACJX0J_011466 [Zea mays]
MDTTVKILYKGLSRKSVIPYVIFIANWPLLYASRGSTTYISARFGRSITLIMKVFNLYTISILFAKNMLYLHIFTRAGGYTLRVYRKPFTLHPVGTIWHYHPGSSSTKWHKYVNACTIGKKKEQDDFLVQEVRTSISKYHLQGF